VEKGEETGGGPPLLGVRVRLPAYLLTLSIALGLCTIVKGLQVALTPEAWEALAGSGQRLLGSSGFGFLLLSATIAYALHCTVKAFNRTRER
jgi:uncharacterized protein YjeT (DUF2065 family)